MHCASADWMDRNVFRRVEICFPIDDDKIKKRVIADLHLQLQDNLDTWELLADGTWIRIKRNESAPAISAQSVSLTRLTDFNSD